MWAVPCEGDRHRVVVNVQQCQFIEMLVDDIGEADQHVPAAIHRQRHPRPLCVRRRCDGTIDLGGTGERNGDIDSPSGREDVFVAPAGGLADQVAPDQQTCPERQRRTHCEFLTGRCAPALRNLQSRIAALLPFGTFNPPFLEHAFLLPQDLVVEVRALRPSVVGREMQGQFVHFVERDVPTLQCCVDMAQDRVRGILERHTRDRRKPPLLHAESGAKPHLAEDEVEDPRTGVRVVAGGHVRHAVDVTECLLTSGQSRLRITRRGEGQQRIRRWRGLSAVAVDTLPLLIDGHVESGCLRPSAVHREMQYQFPYFGDRQVTAVECRVDVVAQRAFGIRGSDAGQRHEASVPATETRPIPHLGEDEVHEIRRCGRGRVGRGESHHVGERTPTALGPLGVHRCHRAFSR